jgi:Uma2 family endonuclease
MWKLSARATSASGMLCFGAPRTSASGDFRLWLRSARRRQRGSDPVPSVYFTNQVRNRIGYSVMGNFTTPETLGLRWAEVCRDATLQDLPYKIELNAWGKIEMSPASNRHARLQGKVTSELARQLTGGEVLTESPVLTDIGIRVPDVAWASTVFLRTHGEATPYPRAPEICVEIVSPSNSDAEMQEKTRAYLAAGAQEVWLVSEDGGIRYFDHSGEKPSTRYPLSLSLPGPIS